MTISTDVEASREQRKSSDQYPSRTVRAATVLSGTALAALGLTRRGWTRTTLAASGGYLVYLGITGKAAPYKGAVRVAFTINRSPEEVYSFVLDPQNWPRFLQGIEMEPGQEGSLVLSLGKPAGLDIRSEVVVTDERANEYIAWSSLPGALQHRGVIRFRPAPANRGTEISVAFEYRVPAGPFGRALGLLVGWDPEQLVRESLRHLKQLLEAGEIPTTLGQPSGARGVKGKALRVIYREREGEDIRLAGD
jgi:uncharacterized membrane protein